MTLSLLARLYRFVRGDGSLTLTVAILTVFLFALYPMIEVGAISPWTLDVAFGLFMIAGATFLFEPRPLVRVFLALLVITVLVRIVEYVAPSRPLATANASLVMLTSLALGALFIARVTRDGRINIHRIVGACGTFLLLGLVFAQAYKLIARNLAGEMGYIQEAEHHDLYLQFCAGLGINRDRLLEHTPLASTIGAASTMGYYCRNSFEEGLGAFGLAVEMEVPDRPNGAQIIYEGLKRHYQIDSHAMEFWAVHVQAEEEHGENAEKALRLCGQTREQQARIRRAFRFSVLAHSAMTEGFDRFL